MPHKQARENEPSEALPFVDPYIFAHCLSWGRPTQVRENRSMFLLAIPLAFLAAEAAPDDDIVHFSVDVGATWMKVARVRRGPLSTSELSMHTGHWRGLIEIATDTSSERRTASAVGLSGDELLIGAAATAELARHPDRVIMHCASWLGMELREASAADPLLNRHAHPAGGRSRRVRWALDGGRADGGGEAAMAVLLHRAKSVAAGEYAPRDQRYRATLIVPGHYSQVARCRARCRAHATYIIGYYLPCGYNRYAASGNAPPGPLPVGAPCGDALDRV